jgi:hypothetical protein
MISSSRSHTGTLWDTPQRRMIVTIQNQCSTTELICPAYFSNGTLQFDEPKYNIAPNTETSIQFSVNRNQSTFSGSLIYQLHRIVKTTSNNTHIFIAWKIEHLKEPLVYVLLMEHSGTKNWNEHQLKNQYNSFQDQFNVKKTEQTWLLKDNTRFKTVLSQVNQSHYEINVTIMDGMDQDDDDASQAIWIEPNM